MSRASPKRDVPQRGEKTESRDDDGEPVDLRQRVQPRPRHGGQTKSGERAGKGVRQQFQNLDQQQM